LLAIVAVQFGACGRIVFNLVTLFTKLPCMGAGVVPAAVTIHADRSFSLNTLQNGISIS